MIREGLKTLAAVAAFAALMAVLTTTARGADADPPRVETPDPPKLEKRVSDLERDVAALKAVVFDGALQPARQPVQPVQAARSYPLGYSFTANDGVTYSLDAEGHYRPVVSAVQPAAVGAGWSQGAARSPIGHTHTCSRGHTWDHSANPGHNCPVCGESQYVQDSRPRQENVGAVRSAPQVQAAPVRTYTIGASSSGCANGQCETADFRGKGLFGRR